MCAAISKSPTAMRTFVGLLPRMGAHVSGQVAGGIEALGAQSIKIKYSIYTHTTQYQVYPGLHLLALVVPCVAMRAHMRVELRLIWK